MLLLGIAASIGAVVAVGQSNEAQQQRDEAERQTEIAQTERDRAEDSAAAEAEARDQAEDARDEAQRNADEAERQRQEADQQRREADAQRVAAVQNAEEAARQTAIARSGELAAAATAVLDDDPELATMLALESIYAAPEGAAASPTGVIAMRNGMVENRLIGRFSVAESDVYADISSDGQTLFYSSTADRSVSAVDVDSGDVLWTYLDLATVDAYADLGLSPDDRLVAVLVVDVAVVEDDSVPVDDFGNDAHPARVVVLDAADGSVEQILYPGECRYPLLEGGGFTADGKWLVVANGDADCGVVAEEDWVAVYDTVTWDLETRLSVEGGIAERADFSADSSRVLVWSDEQPAELRSFPDGAVIASYEGWDWAFNVHAALSPNGERMVVWSPHRRLPLLDSGRDIDLRPGLFDTETGDLISYLEVDDFPSGFLLSFSPDGRRIMIPTRARDYVFDGFNGQLIAVLEAAGPTWSHAFTDDSSTLATSTTGDILLWELGGGLAQIGVPIELDGVDAIWFNRHTALEGPNPVVNSLVADSGSSTGFGVAVAMLDPVTGGVTYQLLGLGDQLPDGRVAAELRSTPAGSEELTAGPIVVWDPFTGQTVPLTDCTAPDITFSLLKEFACHDGGPYYGYSHSRDLPGVMGSSDGSYIVASSYEHTGRPSAVMSMRTWHVDTLQVRSTFDVPASHVLFDSGPGWVAFGTWGGELRIHDVDSGDAIAEVPWESNVFNYAVVGPGASLIYALEVGGTVVVIDTGTWQRVAEWRAHTTGIRGVAVSADGSRLVTTGEDDFVKVWDVTGLEGLTESQPPPLLDRIPAPRPSDAVWLSDDELGILLADGAKWLTVSLDVSDLVAEAQSRLTRGFTVAECFEYGIEDCPMTLEEIRNRG